MNNIQFQSGTYWIVVIALFAAVFAYIHYRRNDSFEKAWQLWLLRTLRFSSLFLIGILLLTPLIKQIRNKKVPLRNIVLIDNSSSVGRSMSDQEAEVFYDVLRDLKNRPETDILTFDSETRALSEDSVSFDGGATDIHQALDYVVESHDISSLGHITILSDGIYNLGAHPMSIAKMFPVPISAIAVGDTMRYADIGIKRVLYNELAYVGDEVVVEADLEAKDVVAPGQVLTLEVLRNDRWAPIQQAKVDLLEGEMKTIKMNLPIERDGVTRARLRLSTISNERNTKNNVSYIYVDGIDDKQTVKLIARAPHPDLAALGRSLVSRKNLDVEVVILDEPMSVDKQCDLYIFHDLPYRPHPEFDKLYDGIKREGKSALFLISAYTDWDKMNSIQPFMQFTPKTRDVTNSRLQLNNRFSLFQVEPKWADGVRNYPPIQSPFVDIESRGKGNVLAYQRIGNIDTEQPMIVLGSYGRQKIGVIVGQGLYKWPIYEYASSEKTETFDELLSKITQYLTVREDKRRVRLNINKRLYQPGERIYAYVETYNESYEKVVNDDLKLLISDENGTEYPFSMNKDSDHYMAELGPFAPGSYRYELTATNRNLPDGPYGGTFTVQQVDLEDRNLTANHHLLRTLSFEKGGKFMSLLDIVQNATLKEEIINPIQGRHTKAKLVEELSVNKWLDMWPMLIVIIILLIAEWFSRRLFGSY